MARREVAVTLKVENLPEVKAAFERLWEERNEAHRGLALEYAEVQRLREDVIPQLRAERDAALALVEVWRPVVEAARVVVEDYNAGELYFLPRLAATVDALPADTGQEANREHRL